MLSQMEYEFDYESDGDNLRFVAYGNDWEKYYPARISGPPENCYQAEGGYFNDIVVVLVSVNGREPTAAEKVEHEDFQTNHNIEDISTELSEKMFQSLRFDSFNFPGE